MATFMYCGNSFELVLDYPNRTVRVLGGYPTREVYVIWEPVQYLSSGTRLVTVYSGSAAHEEFFCVRLEDVVLKYMLPVLASVASRSGMGTIWPISRETFNLVQSTIENCLAGKTPKQFTVIVD